jgi:hypothetical protein
MEVFFWRSTLLYSASLWSCALFYGGLLLEVYSALWKSAFLYGGACFGGLLMDACFGFLLYGGLLLESLSCLNEKHGDYAAVFCFLFSGGIRIKIGTCSYFVTVK